MWTVEFIISLSRNGIFMFTQVDTIMDCMVSLLSHDEGQQMKHTRNFDPIGLVHFNRKALRDIFRVCTCLIGTVLFSTTCV
jgi:hypothetical protein